jgi:demethylmenaquinone methyltransferase / 2-methoxy-6-polyprenyl-1,4-benzoquinol methylase
MNDFSDLHGREQESWAVRDSRAHGRAVRSMFAGIAGVYDFMNHLLSFNRDRSWRKRVAKHVAPDAWEALDLCAGTGDLALTCLKAGKAKEWIAADFCPEMLRESEGKPAADQLVLTAADAMNLPLRNCCLDVVTVGFGVRNFAEVRRGLEEIRRVLRPGGQLLLLEFFRDDPKGRGPRKGVSGPIRILLNTFIPLLGRLFGRDGRAYSYLPGSMGQFLTPGEFESLMVEYGFEEIFVERQTFGIAHIVGGRRT